MLVFRDSVSKQWCFRASESKCGTEWKGGKFLSTIWSPLGLEDSLETMQDTGTNRMDVVNSCQREAQNTCAGKLAQETENKAVLCGDHS